MNAETDTAKKHGSLKAFDEKLRNKEFCTQILSRDALKFLALILMTVGHWIFQIYRLIPFKPLIRLGVSVQFFAPPVFFFFIAEGYHYTKSKKKYALRLLICALITQIPHSLLAEGSAVKALFFQWSVLMTLFLGLLSLIVLHSQWKLPLRFLAIAGLMGFSLLIKAEWYVSGIVLMIAFDLLREKPLLRLAVFEVLMFLAMMSQTMYFPNAHAFLRQYAAPMTAGIIITFFYNGKQGKYPVFSKYFFYIWYPLHLLLQWLFGYI